MSIAARTFTEALETVVAEHPGAVAVRTLEDEERLTWSELDAAARRVAGGLRELGAAPGDTVCLLLDNRVGFYLADLGALLAGAVPISIYATSSPEQIEYVVRDAGAKIVITQESHVARVVEGTHHLDGVQVVSLDLAPEGVIPFERLTEAEPIDAPHRAEPGDLLTIIYTSGTTGPPKGVELTHQNLIDATAAIGDLGGLETEGGRVISWLPFAHIAERIASYYAAIAYALEVTVCPVPTEVAQYLPQVRPTFFFAVPRFWEKLRAGLQMKLAALPEEAQQKFAEGDEAVLGFIRQAVGLDQIRTANVGAAPCAPEVIEFFHHIGVPLAEIYGMTENCACCTCNARDAIRVGSVGLPLKGIELRIADDGELQMRGPVTTRGYRNQPEKTAELFTDDGWLRTGDIGRIDDDGYLWIVDRKKELIINSSGKNMSPANIESAIKSKSPLIANFCVIGDKRPYNVALVTLDPDLVGDHSPEALRAAVQKAVDAGNAQLSRAEQVKKFAILDAPWIPGGTELTPTQKLKRAPIAEAHAATIDALYAHRSDDPAAVPQPA